MNEINELYHKGYLEKVSPSPLKSALSVKEAKIWIEEAKKNVINGAYRSARLSTYMAFFHAARAVMLRDGAEGEDIRCLSEYLRRYTREGFLEEEWPEVLDWMQSLHHQDMYHFQAIPSLEDVETAIKYGEEFTDRVKILLQETQRLRRRNILKQSASEHTF